MNGTFNCSGSCEYGGARPSFTNWDSSTAFPIAVWTTFVRSKQSIQLTRKILFWLQIEPLLSLQWKPIDPASGASASINEDTFSNRIPRLESKPNKRLSKYNCTPKVLENITNTRENRTLHRWAYRSYTAPHGSHKRLQLPSPFHFALPSWWYKQTDTSEVLHRNASQKLNEFHFHLKCYFFLI